MALARVREQTQLSLEPALAGYSRHLDAEAPIHSAIAELLDDVSVWLGFDEVFVSGREHLANNYLEMCKLRPHEVLQRLEAKAEELGVPFARNEWNV